jgi:hypothetical protein
MAGFFIATKLQTFSCKIIMQVVILEQTNYYMKPFDLQKALAGDPVVTRDGRPVKIAAYNPDAYPFAEIIGWVDKSPKPWHSNGKILLDKDHDVDLFMATKTVKKEGWVNIYNRFDIAGAYKTKEDADIAAERNRIACIRIEWEEEI